MGGGETEEVAEYMKAGGTPKTSEASFWSGKIPFVKVEAMAKPGIYLIGTTSYITLEGLKNSNTWLVPKNSDSFVNVWYCW